MKIKTVYLWTNKNKRKVNTVMCLHMSVAWQTARPKSDDIIEFLKICVYTKINCILC